MHLHGSHFRQTGEQQQHSNRNNDETPDKSSRATINQRRTHHTAPTLISRANQGERMTYVSTTSHEAMRVHPKATIEMNLKFL